MFYVYIHNELFRKRNQNMRKCLFILGILIFSLELSYAQKFSLPSQKKNSSFIKPEISKQSINQQHHISLKTNLLYDVLLIPNIGLDFYLKNNWSLSGNWMYAWWKNNNRHRFWRVYGGDIEVRRWFGVRASEKSLTGHHLGLYAGIVTYDFEWEHRGYLGDRWSYGGGISYGYAVPIARRLNLDFSIGVGYLGGEYKEYLPIDTHYVWQSTKQRHWFGPTKAEISLVWLIGANNFNRRKVSK